jgi:hypothetical protein
VKRGRMVFLGAVGAVKDFQAVKLGENVQGDGYGGIKVG